MELELGHVTWQGPPVDDEAVFERLPGSLQSLLGALNGFIQFGGGLHVRGACATPEWHAIAPVWSGARAFHRLYASVSEDWVPFAEDCVGDQFFLREKSVVRLSAETGEVDDLALGLSGFLARANAEPVAFLSMEPLLGYLKDHPPLSPGHLLHAYPPFCTQEAREGVSLRAVPARELHEFHARLAAGLPGAGECFRVKVTD